MDNKFEISVFSPCEESITFRKQFPDFKSAWENCPRGDWMLWIAQKLDVDKLKLTTAKALCANTVRHLMKDERSIKAVDVAILFGQGKATIEELNNATVTAATTASSAYAAVTAADAAAVASWAVADASWAAADASWAAAAAVAAAYSADAKTKNQLQTADICREILTEVVFEAIDKLTA